MPAPVANTSKRKHAKGMAPPLVQPNSQALDRPGWIPDCITENWDTDPYAYQTEEELMPQGGPHDSIIDKTRRLIRPVLNSIGKMAMHDVFVIFRDKHGVLQRNAKAADLMVVEHEEPPPTAWYLDQRPAPVVTMEVPSEPDEDVGATKDIFIQYGVKRHLVIDQLDAKGNVSKWVKVRAWGPDGKLQKADSKGFLHLPEIGLKIKAKSMRSRFTLYDRKTGRALKLPAQQLAEKDEQLAKITAELEELRQKLAQSDNQP